MTHDPLSRPLHCIINMKINYHQTFIVICLMTYTHVRFSMKKSLVNYKKQINSYLALNISKC